MRFVLGLIGAMFIGFLLLATGQGSNPVISIDAQNALILVVVVVIAVLIIQKKVNDDRRTQRESEQQENSKTTSLKDQF
jgi:Ca2+/Na+ antiporter